MTNPYEALNDINKICKALNYCLDDPKATPSVKLVAQAFLLQISQATQDYTQSVQPLAKALMEKK